MKTERLSRVLQKLEAQGIPQMIISDPVSIFYLTGYSIDPGERLFALYINKNGGHKLFVNLLFHVPEGLGVEIDYGTWTVPPVFSYIQKAANIELEDMCSTFNMGVGMMMMVPADKVEECMGYLKEAGEEPTVIGRIVKGNGVTVCVK